VVAHNHGRAFENDDLESTDWIDSL